MDYLEIGSSPRDEDCVQVGDGDYILPMKNECRRFKELLEKLMPIPKECNCRYYVKSNPHDFGTYYEVAIQFDEEDAKSSAFAYYVDSYYPQKWNDTKVEMTWKEYWDKYEKEDGL
jgi:hypothetical protein